MFIFSQKQNKQFSRLVFLCVVVLSVFVLVTFSASAATNPKINYQGKLTNTAGVTIGNGTYNVEFKLYTQASGGSAIWTETLIGGNGVSVVNGLFSVMLGSTTPLTSVNFNQTLYLGVNIAADGEMSPRKVIGTVPAAFEARRLDGVASSSLVRSDEADVISASTASTLLTITQNGVGDILNLFDGGTKVFSVLDGGNVGIGTSTSARRLTVAGDFRLTGSLYDTNNSAGTSGMVLRSTGTGQTWVATSTLGLGSVNSVALAAPTGFSVSGSPVTSSGTLTLSFAAGYEGLRTASSTNWNNFYNTPSTRISDGTGLTWSANTLNCDTASAGAQGCLTSVNWTTFNNKVSSSSIDTSSELLSLVTDETGSGALVFGTSPTLTTPALGTPSALVGTNITGTASGLTAGNVTTNANLTGAITSTGNATVLGSFTSANLLSALTDETGTGRSVFSASPAFSGTATFASLTATGTATFATTTQSGRLTLSGAAANIALGSNYLSGDGGDEGVFVDSTGGVGIGTTTPISQLHIASPFNYGGQMSFTNTNSDARWTIGITGTVGSSEFMFFDRDTGQVPLLINDSGFIGIGTTTPSRRLTVGGSAYFGGNLTATGTVRFSALTASRGLFLDSQSRATTTALSASLISSITDETGTGVLVFSTSPTLVTPALGTPSALVGTNITGTASGLTAGSVTTNANLTGAITSTGNATVLGSFTSANLLTALTDETGTGRSVFSIAPAFSGTATFASLTATGTATFATTTQSGRLTLSGAAANIALGNNYLSGDGGDEGVVVDANGNVGIGTTTPSRTLTVAGSARITGALYGANNSAGTNGMVLRSTGTGFNWVATSTLGLGGGSATFLGLSDVGIGSFNTGRLLFETGSAVTDSSSLTFASSKLTTPTFNASGASTTVVSFNNNALLVASSSLRTIALGIGATLGTSGSSADSFFVGLGAGANTAGASYSNFLGLNAGEGATNANNSNFFGDASGQSATGADNANFLGRQAGIYATNANNSNFFGQTAGYAATNANNSNFFGYEAGHLATNANNSIFIGHQAGSGATNAEDSIFLGAFAGDADTVNNTSNNGSSIAIGRYAGTGGFSNSIALGRGVVNSTSSQLNIGNVLYATNIYNSDTQSSVPFAGGSVGIGTTTPISQLHIASPFNYAGQMSFTNTNSDARWTIGITGTVGSSEFMFFDRDTGQVPLLINDSGFIGIGTTTPAKTLSVAGDLRLTGALFDRLNSAGSNGSILKSTATGQQWVATSTLGLSSSFTTSAGLAALLSDETGSGAVVFGTSPTLSSTTISGIFKLPSQTSSRALFTDAQSRATTTALSSSLLNSITDETGTGVAVFATSPTLVTPALGTPSALVGTNITGTAAGLTAGNVTTNANLTGMITSVGNAASLGSFTSANLLNALTDETGTGRSVFSIAPAFSGTATFASLTATGTASFATTTQSGRLTLSGTVANVALGSNYLSGDGGDEGVFIHSNGGLSVDVTGSTYDIWIQGATSTISGGDSRNLALLGDSSTDDLILNWGTEYDCVSVGGSSCTESLDVTGSGSFTGTLTLSGNTASRSLFLDSQSRATTTALSASLISSITDETGSGALVFGTSPTLVTPALGTPSALVGTNITGTASGLTAGSVTTNANLTGAITSTGNATVLGSFTSANLLTALTDETGTGRNVFSIAPAFSGTATFASLTATGTLLIADGATSTPSLAFSADTNTGLFRPTADTLRFVTAGTGRLTINALGRVGIGTNAPDTDSLDVQTALTDDLFSENIRISQPGTSVEGSIGLYRKSSLTASGLTLKSYGSLNVNIDTIGGNAGSFAIFDTIADTAYDTAVPIFDVRSGTGNVGIGATTSNQALSIFRNAADAAVEFSTVSGANEKWTIGIDDSDGAKFKISSSSALGTNDRFVINGSGNVGIGTSTPRGLLHSSGDIIAGNNVILGNTAGVSTDSNKNIYNMRIDAFADDLTIVNNTSDVAGKGRILFTSAGIASTLVLDGRHLGLGDTTPDNVLDIASSTGAAALAITSLGTDTDALIKFELTDNSPTFTMGIDDSDSDKFKISGSALGTNDRLVIDSSGNVGIGTSSPSSMLTIGATTGSQLLVTSAGALSGGTITSGFGTINIGSDSITAGSLLASSNDSGALGASGTAFSDLFLASGGVINWNAGDVTLTHAVDTLTLAGGTFSLGTSTQSGRLTFSGSVANIALGSNWLSGDGDDEGIFVTSTGNVGIGTSTPENKLHVYTSGVALAAGGANNIVIEANTNSGLSILSNAASTGNIYFGDGTSSSVGSIIYNHADDSMSFSSNTAERLRITSAGNIGIGTTTPNQKLSIFASAADAAIEFSTVSGANEKWTMGIDDSDGAKFKISSSSALGTNDRLVINGLGNMGIGTSSPTHRLQVVDSQSTNYVSRISNTNTGTDADGLLISLAVANASRATSNYFVGFSDGAGTVAGKIQGGASAVAYTTTAADLAEYFPVNTENDMPLQGEIVALDSENSRSVKRAEEGDIPFGIVATNPGFIGNGPICKIKDKNCDAKYAEKNALVSLIGQVPLKVTNENGAIAIGDSVTLSATAGVGMKAGFGDTAVGYALESFDGENESETLMVFVQNHTALGMNPSASQLASWGVESSVFEDESLLEKMARLASGFVNGVLTIAGIKTDELCIGDTCVNEAQLIKVLNQMNSNGSGEGGGGDGSGGDGNGGGDGGSNTDEEGSDGDVEEPLPENDTGGEEEGTQEESGSGESSGGDGSGETGEDSSATGGDTGEAV